MVNRQKVVLFWRVSDVCMLNRLMFYVSGMKTYVDDIEVSSNGADRRRSDVKVVIRASEMMIKDQ